MKTYIIALCLAATHILYAQNDTLWSSGRPDGHAPIKVMGDHTHEKGEFMISYRYMYMHMQDLKRGDDTVPFSNALAAYMVTPTRMPMQMQMLGMMYAPSDQLTLMVMGNYLSSTMDHSTRMGSTFTTKSAGFGDTKVAALYTFFNKKRQRIHAQVGVSIPTGAIDKEDETPASRNAFNAGARQYPEAVLPYPMQIGSGTFDGEFALTYLKQWAFTSFGTQAKGTLRFGENDNDYTLGNQYSLNSWFAINATENLSFSARIEGKVIDEIKGSNPDLNPMMVITADTENSGATVINSGIGMNFYVNKGSLKNVRLGLEFGIPIYQDLNGVQLQPRETFTVGIQYSL